MAIYATLTLQDSYGRVTTKRVETDTTTVAGAEAAIDALIAELNPLTDLQLVYATYSWKNATQAFAGVGGSNVDVGATMQLLLDSGKRAAFHLPGLPAAKVGAGGMIDPADEDVAAFFALFESGGDLLVSDGETVDSVIGGSLDK
jgi:hypothetical protein